MKQVAVKITKALIDEHGEDIGSATCCPGYFALRAAGVDVMAVWPDLVTLHDGRAIPVPQEFEQWQWRGMEEGSELKPLDFTLEIPSHAEAAAAEQREAEALAAAKRDWEADPFGTDRRVQA